MRPVTRAPDRLKRSKFWAEASQEQVLCFFNGIIPTCTHLQLGLKGLGLGSFTTLGALGLGKRWRVFPPLMQIVHIVMFVFQNCLESFLTQFKHSSNGLKQVVQQVEDFFKESFPRILAKKGPEQIWFHALQLDYRFGDYRSGRAADQGKHRSVTNLFVYIAVTSMIRHSISKCEERWYRVQES